MGNKNTEEDIKKLEGFLADRNKKIDALLKEIKAEKARSELFLKQIQKGQELNDKLVEALKTSAETNVKAAKAIAVFVSRSEN